ncbi:hypothetical protein ACEN2D_02395 [Corynebacterium auriscanis]|uniref:hypothetical protein n=1 Tax=Corynebacterium auriscanis TaxID=99807 RepID=UPI003CEE1CCA
MNHDNNEPQHQTPGVPDGNRKHPGPEGQRDVPPRPEPHAPTGTEDVSKLGLPPGINIDELRNNPVLLAQVTAYLQENHLHLPLLTPDLNEMVRMKRDTPELYETYVLALRSQIKSDEIARTTPYTEPAKAVNRGQLFGLIAVVAVLAFCAYLAFLGYSLSAGIIAALDLVALASVFANGGDDKKKS